MTNNLSDVLTKIGDDYKENIRDDSRFYLEISITQKAAELGFLEVKERYKNAYAIVPLKCPVQIRESFFFQYMRDKTIIEGDQPSEQL